MKNKKVLIGIIAGAVVLVGVVLGIIFITPKDDGSDATTTTTTTTTQPPHTHIEVIDPAVEATCEETGLTEGKHCSVCGETVSERQRISPDEYNISVDNGVADDFYWCASGVHLYFDNDLTIATKKKGETIAVAFEDGEAADADDGEATDADDDDEDKTTELKKDKKKLRKTKFKTKI